MRWLVLLAASTMWGAGSVSEAVSRAVAYLSVEVPGWKKGNGCYSCHNNGDAARALMVAGKTAPLSDTLEWLRKPEAWNQQQADAVFRDKDLARVQFAHALVEAVEAGLVERAALARAAADLVKHQDADGCWRLEQEAAVGSPATYGTPLATYAALRVLRAAGGHKEAVGKAERYLTGLKPVAVVDVAAVELGLAGGTSRLGGLQNRDGGWGPFRNSPSEAFDTAIAVLALSRCGECGEARAKGVRWLVQEQLESGGWVGTTRPSGADSYAQHISTTGWALLALLKAKP